MTAAFTSPVPPPSSSRRASSPVAAALVVAASAPASAAAAAKKPRGPLPGGLHEPRRHLRGEPLVRQPLRRLGPRRWPDGQRPAERDLRDDDPGRAGRHRVPVPPAERREPHLALSPGDDVHRRGPQRSRKPLHEQVVHHRRLHRSRRTRPARRPASSRRTACSRARACPAAAPATSSTASTRSSTRSTAASRTATSPVRTRSASTWAGTRRRPCRSTSTCTARARPNYVVADNFFQGAFGGSFLNHQYLIAARAPVVTPVAGRRGATRCWTRTGFPNSTYPLYHRHRSVVDGQLTQACTNGATSDYVNACGNIAVNTIQPASPPFGGGAAMPLIDDTVYPNIGDRMSARRHHAGTGTRAAGTMPRPVTPVRCSSTTTSRSTTSPTTPWAPRSLAPAGRDEVHRVRDGTARCPQVSFVKPYGAENEHPGYASEPDGSDHLVDLLQTIMSGPQAEQTLVVVTYDEFGGQWDHVSPPAVDNVGTGHAHPGAGPVGRHGQVRASTTPSTTRRRSWRPSSTASAWLPSPPATPSSTTWPPRSGSATRDTRARTGEVGRPARTVAPAGVT